MIKYGIKLYVLTLILSVFLLNNFCFAQELPSGAEFQHYTKADGLSQQVIRAITQDKAGFIWIGTEAGLNRFDGYEFRQYFYDRKDSHSLPDNFIYVLTPCFDGGIWIGTNSGGIAKYNPSSNNFTRFYQNSSQQNNIGTSGILALYEDHSNNLWIGTDLNGLFLMDTQTQKLTHYIHDKNNANSLSSDIVFDITCDKNGDLWLRTANGINKFDPVTKMFSFFSVDGSLSNLDFRGVFYLDNNNMLWFSNEKGLLKFNTKTKHLETVRFSNYKNDDLSYISITSQDDNHLWIAGYRGIFQFNKTDYSVVPFLYDEKRIGSLFAGGTLKLFLDRTGSLWAGSKTDGLSKLNLNRKKFIRYSNYLNDIFNPIRSLMVDKQDNIWVGPINKQAYKINTSSKIIIHHELDSKKSILESPSICCFMNGPQGNIWAGTWGKGIQIISPQSAKIIKTIEGEGVGKENIVQALRTDRWGNIWIGKESGLLIFNPESKRKRYFCFNKNNSNSIVSQGVQSNCIIEDCYHNTWIGTWGGLSEMIPGDQNKNSMDVTYTFKNFIHDDLDSNSISDSRIVSLYYDKINQPDIIYAGTYGGGLNRIQFKGNPKIKTYTHKNGLPDDVIYAILGDDHHRLWMSTNNAVSSYDPVTEIFKNYNVSDGIQSNQFYWGSAAKGNHGELLFGAINGFILFHPDEIVNDSTLPEVVFTDFKLFNRSVEIGQKIANHVILKKAINETQEISLDYKENIFSIEFAALHYAFPVNNRYRYKLEGFDNDWIEVDSKKRYVSYTNLNPGKYTFKVKASNYDGVWTRDEKTIVIMIQPPFWQTWWFRCLLIVLTIFSILGYNYRRIAVIEKKNRKLERLVLLRTSEIEEKNSILLEQTDALNSTNTLLEENQQYIEEQSEELLSQTEQLTQLNATKDKLFSILAHDLRNPFNVLIGLSEVLLINKNHLSAEKIEKYLGLIHTSSLKGNDLLENILQWSRTQIGRMSFQPDDYILANIVEEVKKLHDAGALQKNITINQNIDPAIIVFGDENMLKTIFRNLMSNAIKFTPANGTISLNARIIMIPRVLEISVSDTGVGIPEDLKPNLFQGNNFNSTNGTAHESGTGLGLIICKEFVEIHNGTIWFESDPNHGSTFYISLPHKSGGI